MTNNNVSLTNNYNNYDDCAKLTNTSITGEISTTFSEYLKELPSIR